VVDIDRVSDVEILRTVAKVQDAEIRRLHDKLTTITREVATLKGGDSAAIEAQLRLLEKELADAYRRTYERGSERRPREKPEREKKPQTGHGPKEQPRLPIVEEVHTLDEPDKVCTSCGGALEAWAEQFEESEEIDVVEIQYVLKKHRRQKYRCRCGGCVETAPGPTKLVPGGRYSLDLAVHVAVEKYCDALPLERQVKRMRRAGLEVDSQTLWDQTLALSRCFKDAMVRLHQHLLSQDVLLADESHWPVLGVKGRPTKNWFDWALVSDHAILHTILDSRSNEAAVQVLAGYTGILLTDGYIVYESQSKKHGFTQAHDWSHARRKFLEAEASAPAEAAAFLDDIGKLFLIEREIAERGAGLPAGDLIGLRGQVRREQSKPIVQQIGERAMEVKAFRESPIAKAVKYLENRWAGLIRFLADGRIPITSNAAERALRGVVLGRNNYHGSKSRLGTEVAAIFYSLIDSAKLCGLEPKAYLKGAALEHLRGNVVPLPHELV
jgi:transposase